MRANLPADLDTNPLYMMLYQLAHHEAVKTILEVGSAGGDGSTAILKAALQPEATLYCLEAQPEKFAQLDAAYATDTQIVPLPYLSVYPPQLPDFTTIASHWQAKKSYLSRYSLQEIKRWHASEQAIIEGSPEVSGIAFIQQTYGIETFDMVLLDGAEFLGQQDYEAVKGAQIIVLDDILTYKNQAVFEQLTQDPDYFLLYHFERWGHGCAAFKKKSALQSGLSVVIHTQNEEKNIQECISSLQNLPSELIVVDMYSEDQTQKEVLACAKKCPYPIRWVSHVPTAGVDVTRNFGLSQVKYENTLVLDADERLNSALQTLLPQLLESKPEQAFWIARKNIFFGAPVPHLFPDYQLRLFPSYGVQWAGGVHQFPRLHVNAEQMPVQFHFLHYSYPRVIDFIERQYDYAEVYWQTQNLSPAALSAQLPELRSRYNHRAEQLQRYLKANASDDHSWLVHHLYLFSELTQLAVAMEKSGQLQKSALQKPRLSAYSYLKNGVLFDYPFCESLLSILPVCDEVVVTYARHSQDQTFQVLQKMTRLFPQLRLYPTDLWEDESILNGQRIAMVATEARNYCEGDWLWHVQADEVYTRQDALAVPDWIQRYHAQAVDAFVFPILHFYGNHEQYVNEKGPEEGWYQSCIRLARRGSAEHIGDAWTQQVKDPERLRSASITIYHYGHVREPEAMRLKSNHMERLYKALPENFEVCPPQSFVYDRVSPALLSPFKGYHPEVMARRIAKFRLAKIKSKKPRLLVISRSPGLKKGYGITFSSIYKEQVLQQYYEVHHLAWHYYEAPYTFEGVQIYPDNEQKQKDPDYLQHLLYALEPEVILLHADLHFFQPYLPVLQAWQGTIVGWFTIDYAQAHNPSPLLPILQRCQRVLGLADYGIEQMRKDYAGPIAKVPLGIDTRYFKPVDYAQKIRLRQQWEVPEHGFIFLTVANNFWRKGIEYAVQSFYEYCEKYPEAGAQSFLYLHTERTVELAEQVKNLGLSRKVMISPDYDPIKAPISTPKLAELYQLSDSFLLTSLGEGFGMTLLEAQASGLPVIASNNSVIQEVTQNNALYIPCPARVPGKTGGRMVWMNAPDTTEAAFLMHKLFQDEQLRFQLAEKALQDVRHYNWNATAFLLAGELSFHQEQTPAFDFPEPQVKAV